MGSHSRVDIRSGSAAEKGLVFESWLYHVRISIVHVIFLGTFHTYYAAILRVSTTPKGMMWPATCCPLPISKSAVRRWFNKPHVGPCCLLETFLSWPLATFSFPYPYFDVCLHRNHHRTDSMLPYGLLSSCICMKASCANAVVSTCVSRPRSST